MTIAYIYKENIDFTDIDLNTIFNLGNRLSTFKA